MKTALMSKTIAVQVRCKSLYISLPSSGSEMANSALSEERELRQLIF